MILAIYDLSGIQNFIFSSNKLKEIIGASVIVNNALFENIPTLLKENKEDWSELEFSFDPAIDFAKTVYIGGGNAMVMYKDEETEKKYTKALRIRIFEQAGGALKLCSAAIQVNPEQTVKWNLSILMEKLGNEKRNMPDITSVKGFSLNVYNNVTYEPVLLVEDNKYTSRSIYLKNEAYKNKASNFSKGYFNKLKTKNDLRFVKDFESVKENKGRSYIAVIHIDGNSMGIKIREFIDRQVGDLIYGLNQLKKLSAQINEKYCSVLSETINNVFGDRKGEVMFRPVIIDGDDITLICESKRAFSVVEEFMTKLLHVRLELLSDFVLTAAAGIAFVKVGFPFITAYEIAEQCCKNAKKKTIERNDAGKSAIDFQVCYGGTNTNVNLFRKNNYCFNYEDVIYNLSLRPYIWNAHAVCFDYNKNFKSLCQKMLQAMNSQEAKASFARSKLKGLRNAYGAGVLQAKLYGDFIKAREDNNKEFAEELSEPFYENHYAKFFDMLDVLDLIEEEVSYEDPETEN